LEAPPRAFPCASGGNLVKNDLTGQEGRNAMCPCVSAGHLRVEMTGCVSIKK